MNKRELFKMTGVAAAYAMTATAINGSLTREAFAETIAASRSGRKFKVIDWRRRPPLTPYKGFSICGSPDSLIYLIRLPTR